MDPKASATVTPLQAIGCVAIGGLAGLLLAAAGQPWPGAVAWTFCVAGGGLLLHKAGASTVSIPTSLTELLAAVATNPDHPQAPLATEIRLLGQRIEVHGDAVRSAVRELQEHATLVAWVIDTLNRAVAEARQSLDSMNQVMGQVGGHAANVLSASEQGMEFIEGMGDSTEALFQGAETLNQSVEEATASVMQVHGALSGVDQGVGILSEASDQTTEFISQVGRAMGDVRVRVDHSLDLSQKVQSYARTGRDAVAKVGQGVAEIQSTSESMIQSIQALSTQSSEIEGVLGIITDVAEETGMLSLNAAILAAQAGEKGAAFGVVADQIRSLARRTRESTKHIEELIRGIQTNIAEANQGLAETLAAVSEGGDLSRKAVQQLEAIESAAEASVDHSRQIADASQEQDGRSRAMVDAAAEVNNNLHQVAENVGQSTQEMERIQSLIQTLGALSQQVHAATDQHRTTGWKTRDLMASFSSQVEGINSGVDRQRETAVSLEGALDQLLESSDSTRESLNTLHSLVNTMVAHADGLRGDVDILQGKGAEEAPA